MRKNERPSRRGFLKTAVTGIAGLAVGAGIGYGASQVMTSPVAPGVTSTITSTKTITEAPKPKETEIRIGCIDNLTGAGGSSGQEIKRTYEVFMDDYNAKGGIREGPFKGSKVKLIWGDAQTLPEVGRTEAERLITEEDIHLLVGSMWSSITFQMKTVTERRAFPLLANSCAAITLTKGANNKWFWRTGPHDELFAIMIFKFMKAVQEKTGEEFKTIVSLSGNVRVSQDLAAFMATLNQDSVLGGYEFINIPFEQLQPSYDSELLKTKALNPDVVMISCGIADGITIVKGMRTLDINPKLCLSPSTELADKRFIEVVGVKSADQHVIRGTWNYDIPDPVSKIQDDMFFAKHDYHIPDGRYWVGIYTAVRAIEKMREASLEPESFKESFNELYIPAEELITPWGVKFYPEGMVEAGQNMLGGGIMLQYFDDELFTVYPFENASKELSFPQKTWAEKGV